MMTQKPEVQVFLPIYNREGWVQGLLDSMFAQTYSNKKIILCDDASTDQTVAKARSFEKNGLEIRVREKNAGGLFFHWNAILETVTAPYCSIYHSDDLYKPEILEKSLAFLEAHPEVDAVFTGAEIIDSDGEVLWKVEKPADLKGPILDAEEVYRYTLKHGNSFMLCPSVTYRTEAIKRVGLFREDLPIAGDLEYWLRFLFDGKGMGYIDEPLMQMRYSLDQASNVYYRKRDGRSDFFDAMDLYYDRVELSDKDKQAYEAMKQLDTVHLGLTSVAKKKGDQALRESVQWLFESGNRKLIFRNFGFLDQAKVLGARAVLPFSKTKLGPGLAQFILKQTDFRTGRPLRWMVQAKRKISEYVR